MYHNSSKVAQAVQPGDILGLHNAVEMIASEISVDAIKKTVSIKTNQGEIVRSVGCQMKVLKKLGE